MNGTQLSQIVPLLILKSHLRWPKLLIALNVRPKKFIQGFYFLVFVESLLNIIVAPLILKILFDFIQHKILIIYGCNLAISIKNIPLLLQYFLSNYKAFRRLFPISLEQLLILKWIISHPPLPRILPEILNPNQISLIHFTILLDKPLQIQIIFYFKI